MGPAAGSRCAALLSGITVTTRFCAFSLALPSAPQVCDLPVSGVSVRTPSTLQLEESSVGKVVGSRSFALLLDGGKGLLMPLWGLRFLWAARYGSSVQTCFILNHISCVNWSHHPAVSRGAVGTSS